MNMSNDELWEIYKRHNQLCWLWRLIRSFALLAERTADRILGLTAIGGVAGKNSFAEMTNSAFCRHSD